MYESWKNEGEQKKRSTQIINVCENHLRADHLWAQVGNTNQRRAMGDANWDSLVEGKVILLGDFNAHSREWNLHCGEQRDATYLEALIKRHYLIFYNEPGRGIRPTRRNTISIIDLTFTPLEIGVLHR